jgi:hypothetical protein
MPWRMSARASWSSSSRVRARLALDPCARCQLRRRARLSNRRRTIRDTQLHEDDHRYRGNGTGAMATLRTAALNLLRLAGFQSIRAGMQAVTHGITTLLAMALRRPRPEPD